MLQTKSGFVICAADERIKIWDMNQEKIRFILKGHKEAVTDLKLTKDEFLISSSEDGSIKVWDLVDLKKDVKTLKGHDNSVNALAISKKQQLISGSSDNTIKFWNLKARECVHTLFGHEGAIEALLIINLNIRS
jgi:WD40 repeat protein